MNGNLENLKQMMLKCVNTSQWLAFTFSPKAPFIDPNMQFSAHLERLKVLKKSTLFILIPELDTNGRLHFHGIIKIVDSVKFYKQSLPTVKYGGFTLIKHNPNDKWVEYCLKEYIHTSRILDTEQPFVYNSGMHMYRKKGYPLAIDAIIDLGNDSD